MTNKAEIARTISRTLLLYCVYFRLTLAILDITNYSI